MAIKAAPASSKTATAAPGEDEIEQTGEATAAKPGAKAKVEAKPNEELVGILEKYDSAVETAEGYFVEFVEFIHDKQIDRNTVVASLMKARSITFESAQSQYSRMKKILNNEEVLQELKDGKITLKVARERTTTKQENPKAAKPEAKEARYTNTLKSFVAAAKESGFTLAEIELGVRAELKSAGIK